MKEELIPKAKAFQSIRGFQTWDFDAAIAFVEWLVASGSSNIATTSTHMCDSDLGKHCSVCGKINTAPQTSAEQIRKSAMESVPMYTPESVATPQAVSGEGGLDVRVLVARAVSHGDISYESENSRRAFTIIEKYIPLPLIIPTRININCPIHGTHSPANTDRCICKEVHSKPRPESYMICGRTLTEIRSLVQQDELRKSGLPDGFLELHVRVSRVELGKFIPVEQDDFKPGEGYAKAMESILEKGGIKSALVMRVYGNQEG